MRFETVHAHAFGPLRGEHLELAPGFTVVHGPNEAGKSSWHAALFAGLCGRRRGPGVTLADKDFAARHRPWDGDRWEVGVTIVLADGRRIELRHDLEGKVDCSATDLTLGRQIPEDIVYDGALDGSRLLGLNRRTVLPTLCVRQADILGVLDDPGQLQEQLQRAASTAGADDGVEQARRRIADFRRDHVGTARRGVTKPRQRSIEAIQEAEAALERARGAHRAYLDLLGELHDAEQVAHEAAERLTRLRTARRHQEFAALRGRLQRAEELAARVPRVLTDATEQRELVDEVTRVLASYEHRPPEPALPDGPDAEELAASLAALPPHPDGDLEPAVDVEEAARRLVQAREAIDLHGRARPTSVDHDLEERAAAMRSAAARGPSRAALGAGALGVLSGVAAALAGATLVAVVVALLGAGVVLGAVLAGRSSGVDPAELARAEATLAVQHERLREWNEREPSLARHLQDACDDLARVLAARGVPSEPDVEVLSAAVATYRAACRQRAEQARAAARREDIARQLEARRAAEDTAAVHRYQRQQVHASVRRAAASAGITTEEVAVDELVRSLRAWRDDQRSRAAASQRQREDAAALAQLLHGTTLDELREQVARHRQELDPAGGARRFGQVHAEELEAAEARAREARELVAGLRGRVEDRERSTTSVARAEEQLARATAERQRVERLDSTLEVTLGFLERARDRVQRDIAPHLAEAVSSRLPAVTAGRYGEVVVDPATLEVRVRAGSAGRWREAHLLSHGTAEQVYLLLRLAMAERIVAGEGPAPFVLDDVTVHCDTQRTVGVLELLHDVSRDRQVVLFTQEDDVRAWAERELQGETDRLVTLEAVAVG